MKPVDRLETKWLISSALSEPTAERGGRAKRCYRLEVDGERALEGALEAARRMAKVVTGAWGAANRSTPTATCAMCLRAGPEARRTYAALDFEARRDARRDL